ncbi:hypothetical protein EVAR_99518_1 [Eumeta japonica]|uniref:Uncharacterized protein n=1 Tax=Eumeta variegata TaxID=151549 RepID=A0A4C1SGA3_EUMVA|nr:hypothetical protein EVAR_99518_1 [Eumeta japonica]
MYNVNEMIWYFKSAKFINTTRAPYPIEGHNYIEEEDYCFCLDLKPSVMCRLNEGLWDMNIDDERPRVHLFRKTARLLSRWEEIAGTNIMHHAQMAVSHNRQRFSERVMFAFGPVSARSLSWFILAKTVKTATAETVQYSTSLRPATVFSGLSSYY